MGLFDIGIRRQLTTQKSKEELLDSLREELMKTSEKTPLIENETLILNDFKTSILKYDLIVKLEKTNKGFNFIINGELQQFFVLILVALVILSIILTYGIGVAFVVGFAYLQKHYASKFISSLILKNS